MRVKVCCSKDDRYHNWFAWHPVKIGDVYVWLETVRRSRRWVDCGLESFYAYDYEVIGG